MAEETLLEKAKKVRRIRRRKIVTTDEHIELAIAWLKDEITLVQMNTVLGAKGRGGNILYSISVWLREAYQQGKIKIK